MSFEFVYLNVISNYSLVCNWHRVMLHQDTLYQELLFILKSKDTDYAKLLFDHISLCSFVIKFALITLDYCCSAKGDKWNLVWSISRKHTSSKCQKTLAHKIYIHWDHSGSLFPGNVKQPEINQKKELCQAYFWIFGKKTICPQTAPFLPFCTCPIRKGYKN